MKYCALFVGLLCSASVYAEQNLVLEKALTLVQQQQLGQDITWQRLMYANAQGNSEVIYDGYFLSQQGQHNLTEELKHNVQALFQTAEPNQSVRCRFPARSEWLMHKLKIKNSDLPVVACPEFETWINQIKPHKATLIYATDFMGNPSSMFGHTLLRLDPKDQKQLNLVSYAVNYAATVTGEDNWSYAWKGLTGQYPGEYSLMPYYRKVKEYGDFESRDLWEYELNLSPEETRFLVAHIWEMQKVSFPYYFVSDNCAYRLLGLIDLVRPQLNLSDQFKVATIPVESIKAIEQQGLVHDKVYRPALETQLLAQAQQHGTDLAKIAHQLTIMTPENMQAKIAFYNETDRAKILEMAYDDLYLQFTSRQVEASVAQPKFRQLLSLRSQISLEKQRQEPETPKIDPTHSHDARSFSLHAGRVQGEDVVEIGHRQAYHDLIDAQGGLRTGTQLLFLDGSVQYRDDELKLNALDLLTVNSYNPMTPFKTPLTWGFNLAWQQESIDHGQFSDDEQHGVFSAKAQVGYSLANAEREHLCYAQVQNYVQTGQALDKGWRIGVGPTVGCQNIWSEHINSLVQVELPYWEDTHQWNLRFATGLNYALDAQNALRFHWQYQQQNDLDWQKTSLGFVHYF